MNCRTLLALTLLFDTQSSCFLWSPRHLQKHDNPLKWRPQFREAKCMTSKGAEGFPIYDPYSDGLLRKDVDDALVEVKKLSVTEIRQEMKQIAVSLGMGAVNLSAGLVERSELENLLARLRVKLKLNQKQSIQQDTLTRQRKASLLAEELEAIERSFTDQQIFRELRSRRVDFDPLADRSRLVKLLAMSRLGMLPSSNISPTVSPAEAALEWMIGLEGNNESDGSNSSTNSTLKNINATITNAIADTVSLIDSMKQKVPFIGIPSNEAKSDNEGDAKEEGKSNSAERRASVKRKKNNFIESAKKFGSEIAFTEYEKKARSFLSDAEGFTSTDDEVNHRHGRDGGKDDGGGSKMRHPIMTRQEIISNITEALALNHSFDAVFQWAIKKPRTHLVQMLEYRGEEVPKYAPLSMVASIFADSIAVESEIAASEKEEDKEKEEKKEEEEEEEAGPNNEITQNMRYEVSKLEIQTSGSRARDGVDYMSKVAVEREVLSPSSPREVKKRKYDISSYDSFALERDIIAETYKKVRYFLLHFRIQLPSEDKVVSTISGGTRSAFNSVFARGLRSALSAIAGVGIDVLLRMAKWSMGTSFLRPSHTLMLVTAVTVFMRRGLLFFFASFVGLRLLKQILTQALDLNPVDENYDAKSNINARSQT